MMNTSDFETIQAAAEKYLSKSGPIPFADFMNDLVKELSGQENMAVVHWNIFLWLMTQRTVYVHGTNLSMVTSSSSLGKRQPTKSVRKDIVPVIDFVFEAIEKLRDPGRNAIHTVYSGFNDGFREFYKAEGLDPIEEVERLVQEGKLKRRFVRGGALISRDPLFRSSVGKEAILKKIGLSK